MRACTSWPSRYQPSRVLTANVWRRSWMPRRDRGCPGRPPADAAGGEKVAWTVVWHSRMPRVDTKRRAGAGTGEELVAQGRIGAEPAAWTRVQRYLPRLAELGAANGEQPSGGVQIGVV